MKSFISALSLLPLAFGAPLLEQRNAVPGKYFVILKPEAGFTMLEELAGGALAGVQKEHTYSIGSQFNGFAARMTDAQVAALQKDHRVAYLERDGMAHTQDVQSGQSMRAQEGVTWGLGRISHAEKGSTQYLYDDTAGEGTCSYIIDTGVNADHPEFEGRATFVKNFASAATTDDNGHGTHVAGTIGSKTYGVAKKTKIYAIKALDDQGSGAWTTIVDAIQFAVSDSQARSCPKGIVVNMSLGGGKTQSVNDAVAAAVDAGLFFAVAAGNDGADFSTTSPASEPKAFAVGASDSTDLFASFSNYGDSLGVIAPGVDIQSTWIGSDSATNIISGTSMATPHVVGLAAYLLGQSGPLSIADLKAKIQSLSTKGAVNLGTLTTTPNFLAFNGAS